MAKLEKDPFDGLYVLPAFPLVLVTAGQNVMTAAAFHFYSFTPPSVMVGIRPTNLTYALIHDKGEFGINIPTKDQLDAVRFCGSASGRTVDKFEEAGITRQPAKVIDSCLVAECPVNIECRVVHQIELQGSHRWFIGQIEAVHLDMSFTRDQAVMYWLTEYRSLGEILLKRHV